MKKVPNKIGHTIEELNGDNTHTVQRLQAHHQSQQPILLILTHAMQHPTL